MNSEDLNNLKVAELKEKAKELGIEKTTGLKKAEIIDLILEKGQGQHKKSILN